MNKYIKFFLLLLVGFMLLVLRNFFLQFDNIGLVVIIGSSVGYLVAYIANKYIVYRRYISDIILLFPFIINLSFNYNERTLPFLLYPVIIGYIIGLVHIYASFLVKILSLILLSIFYYWVYIFYIPNLILNDRTLTVNEDIKFYNLRNWYKQPVAKEEFDNKVIVLDFWHMGCIPCLKGLPNYNKLIDIYDKNPNVVIASVNIANDSSITIRRYFNKKNIRIGILYDDKSSLFKSLDVNGVPVSILIDRKGKIRKKYFGWSDDMERQFIELISSDINSLLEE